MHKMQTGLHAFDVVVLVVGNEPRRMSAFGVAGAGGPSAASNPTVKKLTAKLAVIQESIESFQIGIALGQFEQFMEVYSRPETIAALESSGSLTAVDAKLGFITRQLQNMTKDECIVVSKTGAGKAAGSVPAEEEAKYVAGLDEENKGLYRQIKCTCVPLCVLLCHRLPYPVLTTVTFPAQRLNRSQKS